MDSAPAPARVPVALYARYSADSQNPRSCEQQLAEMRAYVDASPGWHVVAEFRDDARSGSYARELRPGWDSLLAFIETGQLPPGGVVLTWDWDRWSRDEYDGPIARLQVQRLGVDVADTVSGIFARGFAGQVLATVKEQSAADELRKIKRRVARGIRDKVAAGYWHGGTPPYGYRLERVDGGVVLEVHPEQAPVVVELYERAAAGEPLSQLARELVQRGVPTATGRGLWRPGTLRNMLASPTYLGAVPEYRDSRAAGRSRFLGTPTLHPGLHQALVPRVTWERVQALYQPQPARRGVSPRKFAFSGLVVCTSCGRRAVVVNRGPLRAYRCDAYGAASSCQNSRTVRLRLLEQAVRAWALELAGNTAALELAARELVVREQEQAQRVRQVRQPLELELLELERKADTYLALVDAGNAPRLVNERLAQVQAAMDKVRAQLELAPSTVEPVPLEVARAAYRHALTAGAADLYQLRPLVARVELPPAPAPVVLVVAGERVELGELSSPRWPPSKND